LNEILVVGSVGYDSISTPKGRAENILGGSTNYFALSSSLYTRVNVVGVVGNDYQDSDIELLTKRGVDITGLQKVDGETFRWSGSYQGDMNEAKTLATHLNVLKDFKPTLPAAYKKSPIVFLANIDPVLQIEVLEQVDSPMLIGLDTMNYWIDSKLPALLDVIRKAQVITINEKEAQKLTGEENTMKAARALAAMGPKAVVIKRGEYGFVLFSEDRFFIAPSFPVETVVDPTGAGDSFAGGFFGFLSKIKGTPTFRDLQEACVHGTVIASFTVEDFGVRSLLALDATKVERRLSHYTRVFSLS
jgi:sugar/nucleoside kinase (ribokinase family)